MQNETVLSNSESRYELLNDIGELECYLEQRINDLTSPNSAEILTEYNVPVMTMNTLKEYLESVQNIITLLGNMRFRELILIKSSKKYVERK
jgi:hypothetical protein